VDTSFIRQQAPFSGTVVGEASQFTSFGFASNFVLYLVYCLFANI
jgi:hypothetical protein